MSRSHGFERKHSFVETNMSRYVDSTSMWLQAEVCTLGWGVADEDTRCGSVFELVSSVRSQPGETKRAKDPELAVVRLSPKELVKG